ncbi:CD180 antigen [Hyperolius riggenbachi]|uniref:CD180 antigen n=1 Tax=Hyperolius riggenbachi TaxID=752182 RepID=UPI0035A37D04
MLLLLYPLLCRIFHGTEGTPCIEVTVSRSYDCEGLGLQEVPDSVPNTTEILDFSFNFLLAVYHFTFSRLEKLEYLDLARCGIAWLYSDAFSNHSKLNTVILTGNSILYIDETAFLGATSLRHLYLQETSVSDLGLLPVKSLSNLETLHLGSNFISSIELPDNIAVTKLKTLNFELNSIRRISAEDAKVLKQINNLTLILRGNDIEYIEPNSFNISNFYSLDLTGCARETDLSSILKGLHGLTTETLGIGTYADMDVQMDTFPSTIDCLCNISINELSLQFRAFDYQSSKSFPCLSKTQKLDFTSTDLYSLPEFGTENKLKELILSHNKLKTLCSPSVDTYRLVTLLHIVGNSDPLDFGDGCLKSLSNLQYLDLSHNLFVLPTCCSSHFSGLNSLVSLNLSYGSDLTLSSPAFPHNSKIEVLDLSHGRLKTGEAFSPFSNLVALKVLNVSRSYMNTSNTGILEGLENLSVLNMAGSSFENGILKNDNLFLKTLQLETLILSQSKLSGIEDQSFQQLRQLKHVDLSFNNLTVFNPRLFVNLTYAFLNYAHNSITIIPIELVEHIPPDMIIDLSHNPIDCSCANIDFLSWYKVHTQLFLDRQNTVCGTPSSLEGTELSKVTLYCVSSALRIVVIIAGILITITLIIVFARLSRKRFYSSI